MNLHYLLDPLAGKERLAIVWRNYLIGVLLIGLALAITIPALQKLHSPTTMAVFTVVFGLTFITYQLWSLVSLWLCAFNAK
jgi:hypothetical protein